ncbi:TetR/AcrR family transcriptional regulator [Anaerovoracaceae bacterium 42-11]|nr:TetR family transcriptional regulator [Emergencia sp.]
MSKDNRKDMKSRIIDAAWKLFREKGYENTTLDNILEEAQIAKGSFYYYFKGKGDLLATWSDILDEKYEKLEKELKPEMDSFKKLLFLNREIHAMIEDIISPQLIGSMYAEQLQGKGYRHLLDTNRVYFRLITRIIEEGQRSGELTGDMTVSELVRAYVMTERSIVTDWCLTEGAYSLAEYSKKMMPLLLGFFRR